MLSIINMWQGQKDIERDGDTIHIHLYPEHQKVEQSATTNSTQEITSDNPKCKEYRIKVKKYMTQKASPEFDFMAKWNDDNPMPLRIMVGEKVKETAGMVYMELHGDMYAEKMTTCMKCGRPLTNPVSQYFGIGPECGGHNYVNPFESDEELRNAVDKYRAEIQKITWSGWVIKSAIESEEDV